MTIGENPSTTKSPASRGGLLLSLFGTAIVRFLGAISGFFLAIVSSRYLGLYEAGLFFIAYNFLFAVSAICRLGIDDVVIRTVASESAIDGDLRLYSFIKKSLAVVLVSSMSAAAFTFLFSKTISIVCLGKPELVPLLRLVGFAIPLVAIYHVLGFVQQGYGNTKTAAIVLNVAPSAGAVLAILAFGINSSAGCVLALGAGSLLAMGIAIAALILSLKIDVFNFFRLRIDDPSLRSLLMDCSPLFVVVVMNQAVLYGTQLIGSVWLPLGDVAILSTAQRGAALISLILLTVNMVAAPKFAVLHSQGKLDELRNLARVVVRLIAILSLPIALVMMIAPGTVMGLFGRDFIEGKSVLRILIIGQVVNAITGPVTHLLLMSGNANSFKNITLFTGGMSLVLTSVLTPLFGVHGCAVAMMCSVVIQNLLASFEVNSRLSINLLRFW